MATIKLTRVKCKNLTTKEDMWRLGVKSIGNVSAEDFVKHAAEHCDVKVGTLRAAMAAFVDSAKLFLSMGHGVQLGDLGTLQLSVTSKATKLEKDLTAKNLTGVNVNLRPIGDLAKEIKNFKFSVVGAVNEEDDDNTGTIDPGTGDDSGSNTPSGGGNSNNGSQQEEPETYRITFEFSDDTEDSHDYEAGATINYPRPTDGYKWPDSKPAVMPARNVTVKEVAIAQSGSTVAPSEGITVIWENVDGETVKTMVVPVGGRLTDDDFPHTDDRWDKTVASANSVISVKGAGFVMTIHEVLDI